MTTLTAHKPVVFHLTSVCLPQLNITVDVPVQEICCYQSKKTSMFTLVWGVGCWGVERRGVAGVGSGVEILGCYMGCFDS